MSVKGPLAIFFKLPPMAKSVYLGCEEILSFCEDNESGAPDYIRSRAGNRKVCHLRRPGES
jgi:hypothetical protein